MFKRSDETILTKIATQHCHVKLKENNKSSTSTDHVTLHLRIWEGTNKTKYLLVKERTKMIY